MGENLSLSNDLEVSVESSGSAIPAREAWGHCPGDLWWEEWGSVHHEEHHIRAKFSFHQGGVINAHVFQR